MSLHYFYVHPLLFNIGLREQGPYITINLAVAIPVLFPSLFYSDITLEYMKCSIKRDNKFKTIHTYPRDLIK